MKIAKYFAARGKLTNLDVIHSRWKALTYAASEVHLDILKALIAAGANKDKANSHGTTPLMLASFYGHVEIVKILLAAGAKKDKDTSNGETALTIAILWGHHEVVQLLQPGKAGRVSTWRDWIGRHAHHL